MRLGCALPLADLTGAGLGTGALGANARLVEDIGFSSLWTFDAVGRGFLLPDPLMALTAAATTTESIELGTGIMQLPIRNVAEVAHRVFTLQMVAPGRVLLGVGPGSTAADFDAFGGSYVDRFRTFDHQWTELQIWIAEGQVGARQLAAPRPLDERPTLMLAGWRGGWVERAASEAQGWIASAANADDATLADAIGRYRDAGGERAVVTNIQPGDDLGPTIDRLGRLADMGFDDEVVFDLQATEERLATIAEAMS